MFFPTTDCTGVIFEISDWVLVPHCLGILVAGYATTCVQYAVYSVLCSSRCTRDMDAWGTI